MLQYLKKFINVINFVVLILVIFLLILTYNWKKTPYENSYFEKIGVNKYNYSYGNMVESFGKPNEIKVNENGYIEAYYDDFIMSFWSNDQNSSLMNIRIISDKYKFGSRLIGVGSSKEEVVKAYINVKLSPDDGFVYIDGDVRVEFLFDNHGYVEEILISKYP